MGPNYVLDKGFLATGAAAYSQGEIVVLSGDGTECAKAGAGEMALGVVQLNLDADEVTTGKAVASVRILGIARVIAGAAVAVGARVTPDAAAKAVTAAPAVGANANVLGVALTAAAAANEHIDVLLTPGASMQG